ncbi:hypothetical protein K503DRAFT_196076 [Rhizopogon vinicolor AM-OR11-026]|uniref:DUF6533 domain-containing protein n=1 Tax=Rhizopogon vinicolor AM-OR11-026 TaxID=1314800 RepID=A0A1B7NIY0_9AGAM|nr:hypothetical protein K503DRAFT_196076 [Rhizopogon vinicolor AM-OR11-026]
MTVVTNDPSWWSTIDWFRSFSYFIAASFIMVVYDWILSFGQEVNLIWMRGWSLMTFLYLGVRYIGILISTTMFVDILPTVSLTDKVTASSFARLSFPMLISNFSGFIIFIAQMWASPVVNAMLCVIMITRLNAMYNRSRKIFIFLIIIFLGLTIGSGVIVAMVSSHVSAEEFIMSGTHQCIESGYNPLLPAESWMLGTVWEVLALCLAAWIAVKHFRELRRRPTGWVIGDCLTVLIKSHIFYFLGFAVVAGLSLAGALSPVITASPISSGFLQIASFMQLFVLGPRLILSVREYHSELVAPAETGMSHITTLAFQEHIQMSTISDSSDV